jgi:hypothetical protein
MQEIIHFIEKYLDLIGIEGYHITTAKNEGMDMFIISIPKSNNEKIGILKGKDGNNLLILKKLLHIVGQIHGIKPFVITKLSE